MTKQEVGKLLAVAEGAYPEKTAFWNDATQRNLVTSWNMVLEDYSYEEAGTALKVYLKSDKYNRFPGVGQIVDIIESLKESANPQYMTASQAWAYVRPAISRGTYYSQEEFDKFPDIVKEAVGCPQRLQELAQLPSETVDSVEKSNFCNKVFPAVIAKHKEANRMPADIREMIEKKRTESTIAEKQRIQALSETHEERNLIEYKPSGLDRSEEHARKIHELRQRIMGLK